MKFVCPPLCHKFRTQVTVLSCLYFYHWSTLLFLATCTTFLTYSKFRGKPSTTPSSLPWNVQYYYSAAIEEGEALLQIATSISKEEVRAKP